MKKCMDNKAFKFGDKAKCKGYIFKKRVEYIYATKKHFDKENKEANFILDEPSFYLDDLEEYYQETKKIIEKEFIGVVVGKAKVSMKNHYTLAERDIFDPETLGYIDTEIKDECKVEKIDYIDCYKVYYAMGKSRLVPITKIEKSDK